MKKAIGIDFGTTNSAMAFKDTSARILQNLESEDLTRSCVGLGKEELFIGRTAYQLLARDPNNTVLSVKRLIGAAIKDPMVKRMIDSNYYKFGITELKGGTQDTVAIILGGKQYTPEQISSEILKKLKNDAEQRLNDEVTHAVLTVPAYFTEKQKNATRLAAQLAGLKVQRLLAEPTAAAISYGIDNLKAGEAKTVLIYDFGGGTFDLSILNIVDGQYSESGTGGDRWLGGDDIDRILENIVFEKLKEETQIEDISSLIDKLPDRKRYQFEGQVRYQTESAKIQLSSAQTGQVIIDGILEDENGDWIDIDVEITRSEFEDAIKPLIQKSIDLIHQLLKNVSYDISMIDNILLVGGSSCIPLVKQMLSEEFGVDKTLLTEKPMLAVAEGAAVLANRLGDEYEAPIDAHKSIDEISHTTNHDYFIELKDDNGGLRLEKIIEKQEPKPISVSKVFKTTINNQKIVKVSLYSDIENNEHEKLTTGFFSIEENLPVNSELIFNFELDIDEIFNISVYPKGNRKQEKQIVLGRGNKDSKALDFLSESLDKILSEKYGQHQIDDFIKSVQKEIKNINSIGINDFNSVKWNEIGTNIFNAFDRAEKLTDDIDEDALTIIFARILTNEYPQLIGNRANSAINTLLDEIEANSDPLMRIESMEKLRIITVKYPVLINLFTVKIAAQSTSDSNPQDSNRLFEMHDTIVNHFKNGRTDDAYNLLDEALALRDQLGGGGIDLGSIHLQ